ncbi:hypothetical protein [Rhodococcus sp. NPDC056516]|uniref:hypothetical protein n=1 Tax=Rhodococcus sp. NPDC056516 TaxID=3345847 RepID=UPI003672DD66
MSTQDKSYVTPLSPTVMARVKRGLSHIESLEHEVATWARESTRIVHRKSDDGRRFEVEIQVVTPPPSNEWGQIFGDAVHKLRSALDLWMWEKTKEQSKGDIEPRDVYFPVCTSAKAWRNWKARTAPYLEVHLVMALRSFQPYLHKEVKNNALAGLHQIDNIDKHQETIDIIVVPESIADISFTPRGSTAAERRVSMDQLEIDGETGGVILKVDFEQPPLDVQLPDSFRWVAAFKTAAGIHNTSDSLRIFAQAAQTYPMRAEAMAAKMKAEAGSEMRESDDDTTDDDDCEK